MNGNRPDIEEIIEKCPTEIIDLMKQCWEQEAEKRPTFAGKTLLWDYFCYIVHNAAKQTWVFSSWYSFIFKAKIDISLHAQWSLFPVKLASCPTCTNLRNTSDWMELRHFMHDDNLSLTMYYLPSEACKKKKKKRVNRMEHSTSWVQLRKYPIKNSFKSCPRLAWLIILVCVRSQNNQSMWKYGLNGPGKETKSTRQI